MVTELIDQQIRALELSVAHYERLYSYVEEKDFRKVLREGWMGDQCACCDAFYYTEPSDEEAEQLDSDSPWSPWEDGSVNCFLCPIAQYSGHPDCHRTPWEDVREALSQLDYKFNRIEKGEDKLSDPSLSTYWASATSAVNFELVFLQELLKTTRKLK